MCVCVCVCVCVCCGLYFTVYSFMCSLYSVYMCIQMYSSKVIKEAAIKIRITLCLFVIKFNMHHTYNIKYQYTKQCEVQMVILSPIIAHYIFYHIAGVAVGFNIKNVFG